MAAEEEVDIEYDLSNSDVCTKYREAGRIANLALTGIKSQVKGPLERPSTGVKVLEGCSLLRIFLSFLHR